MKTLQEYLKQATDGYAVSLTANQLKQFDTYYQLLTEWNQKINLTAITDPEGVAVKHFADSLSFFNYCTIPEGGAVIDIGTGAGFPGIVFKIVRPDIKLTLLDSLKKRFLFLPPPSCSPASRCWPPAAASPPKPKRSICPAS